MQQYQRAKPKSSTSNKNRKYEMSRKAYERATTAEIKVDIYENKITIDTKSTNYMKINDKSKLKSSRAETNEIQTTQFEKFGAR